MFAFCHKTLTGSTGQPTWQDFLYTGEEFSKGNYPKLSLIQNKDCQDYIWSQYIVIGANFKVGILQSSTVGLNNRYLIQIRTKSGDYEEMTAIFGDHIADLFVPFDTPEMKVT